MKKNIRLAIFPVMVAVLLLSGCGSRGGTAKIEKLSDLEGRVVGISGWGAPLEEYEETLMQELGVKPKEVVVLNKVEQGMAAVLSGRVDGYYGNNLKNDYYVKKNNKLKSIPAKLNTQYFVAMTMRPNDKQLKADIDKAIASIKENGTLKKMQDELNNDLLVDKEPDTKEMPQIAGAKIIKVGISGGQGLLDYIGVDGRPAGFSAALLSEISRLMQVNFEVMSIEAQTRYADLESKKIDVIFADFVDEEEEREAKWLATIPYYSFTGGSVIVRK